MRRSCMLMAAFLLLAAAVSATAQQKKIRLAVASFSPACANLPPYSKVGDGIADMIITELFKINTFDIIERNRLDKVLQEKNLAQTDLVEESSALKAAKLLNCDAIVIGSITEYSVAEKTKTFGPISSTKRIFTVALQFRIVDAATGRTRLTASARGTVEKKGSSLDVGRATSRWAHGVNLGKIGERERARDARFSEAAQKAVENLIEKVKAAFPPEGYVIKVDDDKVLIDLGKAADVHKGDRFKVIEPGEAIKHPVTGKIIQGEDKEIGIIEVKKVSGDELSKCKTVSGEGDIKPGHKIVGIVDD